MKKSLSSCALVLLAATMCQAGGWVRLFDGKTLNGWSVHMGKATFKAENGAIVGTAVLGSPNTFLCTEKEYSDFILEFEAEMDPGLTSGVQVRSQISKGGEVLEFTDNGKAVQRWLAADRVYGYQVDIQPRQSGLTGNIWDETRRERYLDDFSNRPTARAAFKDQGWNKLRVECKGDSIKTWVNGVPAADIRDYMTAKGIIGLQLHAVPKQRFRPGLSLRWRNLRIRELR